MKPNKVFLISIIFMGLPVLYYAILKVKFKLDLIFFLLIFSLITVILMIKRVWVGANVYYTLEDTAIYAVIFLKGYQAAIIVGFFSALIMEAYKFIISVKKGKGVTNVQAVLTNLINPFLRVLIIAPSGFAYEYARSVTSPGNNFLDLSWRSVIPYLICIVVFSLISSVIGIILISLGKGFKLKSIRRKWRDYWRLIMPHLFMLAPLGVLLALLFQYSPYAAVLLVVPVYILHLAIEAVRDILKQALDTIEFMAITMDERDAYTFGHSKRVSEYSAAIATSLGLPEDKVEEIRKAGLIHDLGKVAIPDRVLQKTSALSESEFTVMKGHTHTAALLFESFNLLSREIPLRLAMYHHERYDGEGYIFGLKGEEIPLGARIVAVADTYDAITSDRPYRNALSEEEARRRIKESSGTQLDPEVVEVFLDLHASGAFAAIKEKIS